MKICKKCNTTDRYKNGRCRTCHINHVRANKDRIYARNNAYNKKYRNDKKELISQKKREYRKTNKERLNEKGRERHQRNKEKYNIRIATRRRGIKSTPEINAHVVWCRQQICIYCGMYKGQHDHIIPISRGGPHSIDNIVPCCQRCNDGKGSKLPGEWIERWYSNVRVAS